MAENRLYLRCRQCGEMLFLSKYFYDNPWHIEPDKLKEINKFFDDHNYCENDKYDVYFNSFDLVSEFGKGFPEENEEVLYHNYDIHCKTYDETQKCRKEYYEKEKELSKEIYEKYIKEDEEDA